MIQTGATALYMASQNGHDDVVQLLLASGASVDLPTKVQYRLASSACPWNGSHLKGCQLVHTINVFVEI